MSYNNEGLMTMQDIKEIMGTRGEYGLPLLRNMGVLKPIKIQTGDTKIIKQLNISTMLFVNKKSILDLTFSAHLML